MKELNRNLERELSKEILNLKLRIFLKSFFERDIAFGMESLMLERQIDDLKNRLNETYLKRGRLYENEMKINQAKKDYLKSQNSNQLISFFFRNDLTKDVIKYYEKQAKRNPLEKHRNYDMATKYCLSIGNWKRAIKIVSKTEMDDKDEYMQSIQKKYNQNG